MIIRKDIPKVQIPPKEKGINSAGGLSQNPNRKYQSPTQENGDLVRADP